MENIRLIINGDIYDGDEINSHFCNKFTTSKRLDVAITPHENIPIPRNAKVELQKYIQDKQEWITSDIFFIDCRHHAENLLYLECYDENLYQEYVPKQKSKKTSESIEFFKDTLEKHWDSILERVMKIKNAQKGSEVC